MRDSETTSRVEPFMFIRFPARSPDVAVFSGALSVPALQTAGGTGVKMEPLFRLLPRKCEAQESADAVVKVRDEQS